MKKKLFFICTIIFCNFIFSQQVRYINTENLNIRKGPGKNYEVVDVVPIATQISVLETSGKWSKIETNDGVKGYVSTKFLSSTKPYVNLPDNKSSIPWKLIFFIIGILVLYRFFRGSKSNSSSYRSSAKNTSGNYQENISSNSQNKKEKFLCKFCGREENSLFFLTSVKCSKSSSGYHIPYEGKIADKYACKFCGREEKNLFFLTTGKCSKSNNNYHQPFEGGLQSSYTCKYCSRKEKNLFFLTTGKCSKSPNNYHQPMI